MSRHAQKSFFPARLKFNFASVKINNNYEKSILNVSLDVQHHWLHNNTGHNRIRLTTTHTPTLSFRFVVPQNAVLIIRVVIKC